MKKLNKLPKEVYEKELLELQTRLVRLQHYVQQSGAKIVIIFEGRDGAGKGGTIKRITEFLNPRVCRIVALPAPNDREKTQWYFQRYCSHLPAAGEIVILDRSWYNRAGVERVMGFCTDEEYHEFLRSCPEFERMLVRSGIRLLKYWFSVSKKEQEKRFRARLESPLKRWKLSEMDLYARSKWYDYARAKDDMFKYTDIRQAPWFMVHSDSKKKARLNCIHHILDQLPYEETEQQPLEIPDLQKDPGYMRPPIIDQSPVSDHYDQWT